ncbi:MAG TPA: glycoside hydrolase family 3 N-terminal domain-containing protein [Streptosporangiaceae bacterium]|jgi:beta-N-acetylhexosaminidase
MTDESLLRLADAVLLPPFPGTTAPRWILDALGRGLGGVTLFGNNVLGDTARLTASLRSAGGAEPVIAIDEEGGDVTRIAYEHGSPYPGNAALGAVDDVALTREVHRAIGADLAELGFNLDLAPCADVLGTKDSPAIGTRSFGSDTDLVARHTAAAVTGLQAAGVAACAKHFPGHGRTSTDSHHALATIEGSLEDLRRRDLPPFAAAIKSGAAAVMPSHLRVPELTGDLAASVSAAAITGLLRGEMGFEGVVISDALEMNALRDAYGIPGAGVRAVAAGTDLLCFGRDTDEEMYLAVRAALVDAVRSGELPASRLEESVERVAALRARLGAGRRGPAPAHPDGIGLTAARRALRASGPRSVLDHPLIIEVEPRENMAAGDFGWGLSPWAPPASVRRVSNSALPASTSPGGAAPAEALDVAGILAAADGRSLVVAVRDAHVDERVRALITGLLAARPDTVLVEMGLPHWSPPDGTSYLATFGASRASAQAAAELLGLAR